MTNLHEVVWTVNQVYAAMVMAVIAAKSQPNLYVSIDNHNPKKKMAIVK